MHHRVGRIDDPAVLLELDQLKGLEQALHGVRPLDGTGGRAAGATVRHEAPIRGEQRLGGVDIVRPPRRVGFVEDGVDRRARIHGCLRPHYNLREV